ncbi:hypothetical protein ACFC0D_12725 [Streptomyces sp. NPDC056222]|uniref:hypothetical protein n=1 Tax=Streptomyces sp. NPDC056222 TaxID=3345749 RepID=UPI0035DDC71C
MQHPQATSAELRAMAAERGRRAVTAEGSFVGGPFMLLVPFAFCGAMLLQARTILELAVLEGRDTTDPERAAELLVLQGVYEDTATARTALRARPKAHDSSRPRPGRITALWDLVMRMARLLGLITPDDDGRSRLVRAGQWALVGVVFLVGLVAPLVWMPYLGVSFYRATTQVTDRATLFYVGSRDTRAPRPGRLSPEIVGAGLRALASILVPMVSVALVLLTDMELAGRRWPLIALVLIVSPVVVGGIWMWRRHSTAHREDP